MDDRELNFSKSEDEQSEMSNHDFEQDIKPVKKLFDRMGKREREKEILSHPSPVIIIIESKESVSQ